MNIALELFAVEGFLSTSISEIAKKAGISKGFMYNYFESKDELFSAIMEVGLEKLMKGFDFHRDKDLSREELIDYLKEIFKMMLKEPYYWKLYYSIIINPKTNPEVMMRIMEKSESFFKILAGYFERKGSKNPFVEAICFVAMLDGVAVYALYQDGFPIDESVQIIIDKFI